MGDNNHQADEPKVILKKLVNRDTISIVREYLLGFKKNGKPRAIYDVIKDQSKSGGKGGKHKKRKADKFSLYIEPGKGSKKKKKSHWEY